jgi:hypothetical protein
LTGHCSITVPSRQALAEVMGLLELNMAATRYLAGAYYL